MTSVVHQFEDKLLEFAYGELPAHEAEAVDSHLRGCSRCSEALSRIRNVRQTMGALPFEPAPSTGVESLLAYAQQTARRNAQARPRPSWWRGIVASAATAAALVLVGVVAWRANDEFRPDPLQVALDLQPSAPSVAEPATLSETPAASPPPPVPKSAEESKAVDKIVQTAGEVPESSNAFGSGTAPAPGKPLPRPKLDLGTSGGAGVGGAPRNDTSERLAKRAGVPVDSPKDQTRASEGKRIAGERAAKDDDYSNAAQRGAVTVDGTSVTQAAQGNARGGVLGGLGAAEAGPALGLVTGAPRGSEPAPQRERAAPETSASKKGKLAPANEQEDRRAEAEPQELVAHQGVPPSAAPPSAGPRSSLGLGLGTKSPAPDSPKKKEAAYRSLRAEEDESGAQRAAASLEASLKAARVSFNSGDRRTEIRLCLEVLNRGAVGELRLEALKRVCDAFDSLGEADRAQPFCDSLMKEFPSTAAARAVVDRQKRRPAVQRLTDDLEDKVPVSPAVPPAKPAATK